MVRPWTTVRSEEDHLTTTRPSLDNVDLHAVGSVVGPETDAEPEAVAALHARVAASSPVGHTLAAPVALSITPA